MRSVVELRCEACGRTYEVERRKKSRSRFCSRQCQHAGNTKHEPRPCDYCGTVFKPATAKQRACSLPCANVARRKPHAAVREDAGTRRATWVTVSCAGCGVALERLESYVRRHKRTYCSTDCCNANKGNLGEAPGRPAAQPGSRRINTGGYTQVKVEGVTRWALEHRLVMEEHLGRKLFEDETVHHRNGKNSHKRHEKP